MNEANTQAEFYHHARLAGLPVELEMTTPAGRLDIAILSRDRSALVAIVECKRDGWPVLEQSAQLVRYRALGVPVYSLHAFADAERLCARMVCDHSESAGVKLSEIAASPRTVRKARGPRSRLFLFDRV